MVKQRKERARAQNVRANSCRGVQTSILPLDFFCASFSPLTVASAYVKRRNARIDSLCGRIKVSSALRSINRLADGLKPVVAVVRVRTSKTISLSRQKFD